MADEIQMTARLYATKNGASINPQTWTAVANMTGTDMGQQTQDVSAGGELLDITADLSLPYKLFESETLILRLWDIGLGFRLNSLCFFLMLIQQCM
jgi:hypothetical protein